MIKERKPNGFIPSDMSEKGRKGFQNPPLISVYVSDMSEEGRKGNPVIQQKTKEN